MRFNKTICFAAYFSLIVVNSAIVQADSKIYGSLRLSVRAEDLGDTTQWGVVHNSSRLGLKVSKEVTNGLTSVAHIEASIVDDTALLGADSGYRLGYVGLQGRYGGVFIGKQQSPFYSIVGGVTDLFNAVGAEHIHSTVRLDNMLSYATSIGRSTLLAAVIADDHSSETYKDNVLLDTIQIGAKFSLGPVVVGAALDKRAKSTGDGLRLGMSATYNINEITIAAEFTSTEHSISNTVLDVNAVELYAGFGLGNGSLLHTSIGQSDYGISTPKAISVGYQKKLSKKTRYWIEAMFEDPDSQDLENTNSYFIGLRNDW